MSINDPVVIVGLKDGRYALQRGREMFWDEQRYLRTWDTIDQARQWAIDNLHKDPFEHLPGGGSAIAETPVHPRRKPHRRQPRQDDPPEAGRQPRLFGEETELPPV